MNDPTSEKAVSDLVLLSRCRAAEALGLDLSPSEVMTLAALAAERDRLADENARMRDALRKLSTAMPRIDIDPLDFLREFVRPTARAALKGDGNE